MSIPKYSSHGFIPIGTHLTTFEVLDSEISKMDGRRIEIWTKFKEFESQASASGLFSKLFFFGSFFSNKLDPSDIDVALQFNENNKPGPSDLWIFDHKSVRDDYLTDVVFIKPSSLSYKNLLPANLKFSDLTFCRSLSVREQREWLGKMKKFCPEKVQGVEYKGVLVVPMEAGTRPDARVARECPLFASLAIPRTTPPSPSPARTLVTPAISLGPVPTPSPVLRSPAAASEDKPGCLLIFFVSQCFVFFLLCLVCGIFTLIDNDSGYEDNHGYRTATLYFVMALTFLLTPSITGWSLRRRGIMINDKGKKPGIDILYDYFIFIPLCAAILCAGIDTLCDHQYGGATFVFVLALLPARRVYKLFSSHQRP